MTLTRQFVHAVTGQTPEDQAEAIEFRDRWIATNTTPEFNANHAWNDALLEFGRTGEVSIAGQVLSTDDDADPDTDTDTDTD